MISQVIAHVQILQLSIISQFFKYVFVEILHYPLGIPTGIQACLPRSALVQPWGRLAEEDHQGLEVRSEQGSDTYW